MCALILGICVQLFGGVVNNGNPRLPGSAIAENEYPIHTIYIVSFGSKRTLGLYENQYNWPKIYTLWKDLTICSYYVKNFNDFPSGMVVLFDLLITGNWHVWMDVSARIYNIEIAYIDEW